MKRLQQGLPLLTAALLSFAPAFAQTERASTSALAGEGDGASTTAAFSQDGRFVAFTSRATNLVPGDTNDSWDVFVRERPTGIITRVSVDSAGNEGDSHSFFPRLSPTGRFVVFYSGATNLVDGDTNGHSDIFVHDRDDRSTVRVSTASDGSEGDGPSYWPAISADGNTIAFFSCATNLVTDDTNASIDVFVHDRVAGTTTLISRTPGGLVGNGDSKSPVLSADGRFVAFHSIANGLVPGDRNRNWDVFVHDRMSGRTERISVSSTGAEANGSSGNSAISADGRFVIFGSDAPDLVPADTNDEHDVFVRDRILGTTTRVSVDSAGAQGNGPSWHVAISANGRWTSFASRATNLATPSPTYKDVFVHDRLTGETTLASVHSSGANSGAGSDWPALSGDGRYVAFESFGSSLVDDDTNGTNDVFIRDNVRLSMIGQLTAGDQVHFQLSGAFGEVGRDFFVLLSCSGSLPGFRLTSGRAVYLNPDACTSLGLSLAPLLHGSIGEDGSARTHSVRLPPFGPLLNGLPLTAVGLIVERDRVVAITSPIVRALTRSPASSE